MESPVNSRTLKILAQRRLSLSLFALCVASITAQVSAAGLEFPESGAKASQRAGAVVSGVNDPSAGFLNPGVLSRLKGLQLMYNHNLIWTDVSFQRAPSAIPSATASEVGRGTSSNQEQLFPYNGLFAMSYQAEGSALTFGASVLGPNSGGGSRYDVAGSQRYMMTRLEGVLGFAGLSIAYGGERWGLGVTPQYALMPLMRYRMIVDGSQPGTVGLNPYESDLDVEAEVSVSDYSAFTAQVGAWFRPHPRFEIAASGRVLPVQFEAEGDVAVYSVETGQKQEVRDGRAGFDLTLPPVARLGLRYRQPDESLRAGERFDVELAVVYEAWHVMNALNVELDGIFNSYDLTDVVVEKRWRDTLSARLGGTYNVSDSLNLSSGFFYEQGATPPEYAHVDFPSFDRFGASLGLGYQLELGSRRLELMLGYLHVFESSSTVSERYAKVFQQRPLTPCPSLECGQNEAGEDYSGVPANAGTIRAAMQSFTLGVKFEL